MIISPTSGRSVSTLAAGLSLKDTQRFGFILGEVFVVRSIARLEIAPFFVARIKLTRRRPLPN